jgi:hypothetical protein
MLVIAVLLLIQTPWVKNFAKDKALRIVNNSVNGNVSVGAIGGSLFSSLYLNDIAVTFENGDTLLALEKLSLHYSLLSLLRGEAHVDSVVLYKPAAHLAVEADGAWNFARLIPESEPDTTDTSAKATSLPVSIFLGMLRIDNGLVTIKDTSALTPESIADIRIAVGGQFTQNNNMSASLSCFTFVTQNPDFAVKNLSVDADFNNERWKVSNFHLATALNRISAKAEYKNVENFDAVIELPQIDIGEFDFVLPDITIPVKPDFSLYVSENENRLNLNLNLAYADESLSLSGGVDNLSALITDSLRHAALLNMNVKLVNIRPHTWIEMAPAQLTANADIHINGNGITRDAVPLQIAGSLAGTGWDNIVLDRGDIAVGYAGGAVNANVNLAGMFGALSTKAVFDTELDNTPFSVSVQTNRLAVHRLLPDMIDSTLVSLVLYTNGKGLLPDVMQASFKGKMFASTVEHIAVDTLVFNGDYNRGDITLDSLRLVNRSLAIALAGFYGKNGMLDADVVGNIYNAEAFQHYFATPVNWSRALLQGKALGSIDSLNFNIAADVLRFNMDTTFSVGAIGLKGGGRVIAKKISAEIVAGLTDIDASSLHIDTTTLIAALNDTLISASLTAAFHNDMQAALQASGSLGNRIDVLLNRLDFDTPFANLRLNNAPAIITYGDSIATLRNFSMVNQKDSSFMINADAYVSMPDSIVLDASIKDFELALLSQMGLMTQSIGGKVNLGLTVGVDAKRFSVMGNSVVSGFKFDPVNIQNIAVNLHYPGDTVLLNVAVHNPAGDSILLNVKSPLTAQFRDSLVVSWNETLIAEALANKVQLKNFLLPMSDVLPDGVIDVNLDIGGTLSAPSVKGAVNFSQGTLPLPRYGINYRDIRLKLLVNDTDIKLDSLFIRHLRGSLLAQGNLKLDSAITSGKIQSADVMLKAKDFYLSNHRDHEAQINADIFFKSEKNVPSFWGNITALRANINLPAIMDMTSSGTTASGEPLLVKALHDEANRLEQGDTVRFTIPDSLMLQSSNRPPFLQQLTGTLKLDMPHNIWIKSDDMQIELYGNLDIVKTDDDFELFGILGIQRGFYALYGKKLGIQEGEIVFTGGTKFNPELKLKASYVFHTPAREKRELELSIGGKLADPNIEFVLDGQSISEADAVSYIVFGQSFDELSFGNQEGVTNNLPSKMLSGLLTSQMSKTLGNTLHLDMIEIEAGDNWQNATFMVGKYLTNNLFVTYKRSFGEGDAGNITPEIITLEYEFTRRISLRLIKGSVKDTGIDMIVKFEK